MQQAFTLYQDRTIFPFWSIRS